MKKTVKIFLIFLVANVVSFAQSDLFSNIKASFVQGNSSVLSESFDNNVNCNILGRENFYSRSQAAVVFKDFFEQYKPKTFEIRHQKVETSGRVYLIGKYAAQGGETFRVTIYARHENEDRLYISQMKIEKHNITK